MSVVFDFSNKHVIVVGGSRGIGKQVCLDFASAGAKVTYVSRNSCNDLDAAGLSHISCDIRDVRHVKKAFDYSLRSHI